MAKENKKPKWRFKTPTVIQMEAVECGAAALGIILGYHKKFLPLEILRVECGVSRDGSKANNILKAARKYGLEAKGFKKGIQATLEMKEPCIVFWNFNHFLVLEGVNKDFVFLNDPGSGPKKVSHEDFHKGYTGIVLTFKPGEDFVPSEKKPSGFTGLKERILEYKPALAFATLTGLCLVIPGLLIPTFTKIFIDNILVNRMGDWLQPLLLVMSIVIVAQAFLMWLQEYYLMKMETKLALTSSSKFFWHLFRLPVTFFSQRFAGDLSSRVSSNDRVAGLLAGPIASAALNVMMILFYGALMYSYDIVLTSIGVVSIVINIIAMQYVSRVREDGTTKLMQDSSKLNGVSQNGLSSIETIKATGGEQDFFSSISGHLAKVINGKQELAVPTSYLNAIPPFLSSFSGYAILGLGGFRVMNGELSMGSLVAFQTLMASFMGPVSQLVSLGSSIQEVNTDIRRIDDVLNYGVDEHYIRDEENNKREDKEQTYKELEGFVDIKKLSFGYNKLEAPLLNDFNLSIKPGSRVALIGGSGSGKSTVSKLIMGLFPVWDGSILFDDQNRNDIDQDVLTRCSSIVDQDIYMFEGSIRDNLTMWNSSIPEKDVIRAAKDAEIHDVIASRPGGYDSKVEEDGSNFSGGQRQRLEIARALVRNPAILVLDEATSALDTVTEKIIDTNIRRRGSTCIIVAHRLSTIRDCDEIIVLDKGSIVERGTHESMKDKNGPYSQLIRS